MQRYAAQFLHLFFGQYIGNNARTREKIQIQHRIVENVGAQLRQRIRRNDFVAEHQRQNRFFFFNSFLIFCEIFLWD